MNLSLMSLELSVAALGVVVLLADLWLPAERKRALGYFAAAALGMIVGSLLKPQSSATS